ncbi:MAG: OstA-like protein [Rikenellaceae bacterium]
MKLRLRTHILPLLILGFFALSLSLSAQHSHLKPQREPEAQESIKPQEQGEKKIVDFRADIMTPIKITADSSALRLVGDVVFYHNGAIITCDSAIRYGDKKMECFNNVIINQKETYIYGDRADYDGEKNIAQVFAPIIKVVDKDAVMYTYNFKFNTLDEIGYYYGNATIEQGDNLIESKQGYYFVDNRKFLCVRNVEVSNPDYKLKSDSLDYNMNLEFSQFYTPTWIWNTDGDILSSSKGAYDNANSIYYFYKNSYILSSEQEIWADSIDYFYASEDAVLKNNIQILDTINQVMAFGDYAQWWDAKQKVLLTRKASVVAYSEVEDTLFMRADTMYLYTLNKLNALRIKQASEDTGEEELLIEDIKKPKKEIIARDTLSLEVSDSLVSDSLSGIQLEQALDNEGRVVLTSKQKRELKKQERKKKKEAKDKEKQIKREAKAKALAIKRGYYVEIDSVALRAREDSLAIEKAKLRIDSLQTDINTLLSDSLSSDDSDSLMRVFRAYYNVEIYRSDVQAVCDSLVGFSLDTTIHMYINPVMWNELNQITSQVIDVYTKDSRITKAIFTGDDPIMSSEVNEEEFNQVRGKEIEAFFRDNSIYKTDINANAHTLYYMTETDANGQVHTIGFLVVESASTTFNIEDRTVESIVYKGKPEYVIYPMNKIPVTQDKLFDNFKWEIERKPTRETIFNRTVRPSQRTEYKAMQEPTFPITERINAHKQRLIKAGKWNDPTDLISELALEFVRSLGYEIEK